MQHSQLPHLQGPKVYVDPMPVFAGKKFGSPPAHRYLQWRGTLIHTLRTQALSRDLQPTGLWGGYGWMVGPDP